MNPFDHAPTGDRIVVDVTPVKQTRGGIYVPNTAKSDGEKGTILAVGPDVKDSRIQAGRVLMFGRYAGTEFDLDGHKVKVIREEDVLLLVAEGAQLREVG